VFPFCYFLFWGYHSQSFTHLYYGLFATICQPLSGLSAAYRVGRIFASIPHLSRLAGAILLFVFYSAICKHHFFYLAAAALYFSSLSHFFFSFAQVKELESLMAVLETAVLPITPNLYFIKPIWF
jgi:hypothetical protein